MKLSILILLFVFLALQAKAEGCVKSLMAQTHNHLQHNVWNPVKEVFKKHRAALSVAKKETEFESQLILVVEDVEQIHKKSRSMTGALSKMMKAPEKWVEGVSLMDPSPEGVIKSQNLLKHHAEVVFDLINVFLENNQEFLSLDQYNQQVVQEFLTKQSQLIMEIDQAIVTAHYKFK